MQPKQNNYQQYRSFSPPRIIYHICVIIDKRKRIQNKHKQTTRLSGNENEDEDYEQMQIKCNDRI